MNKIGYFKYSMQWSEFIPKSLILRFSFDRFTLFSDLFVRSRIPPWLINLFYIFQATSMIYRNALHRLHIIWSFYVPINLFNSSTAQSSSLVLFVLFLLLLFFFFSLLLCLYRFLQMVDSGCLIPIILSKFSFEFRTK